LGLADLRLSVVWVENYYLTEVATVTFPGQLVAQELLTFITEFYF